MIGSSIQTVVLLNAIKVKSFFKDYTISVLRIRKPVVKDFYNLDLAAQKQAVENNVILLSRLTGIEKEIIERLDIEDMKRCLEAINKLQTIQGKSL